MQPMQMTMSSIYRYLLYLCLMFASTLSASTWTAWTEYPADPVFNPSRAYYPSVSYDQNKFNDNTAFYKMWYQGNSGIGLAYSNDGINWTAQSINGLPPEAAHPVVLYDNGGFGGGIYKYKLWYWDTAACLECIDAIKFSASIDGINWTTPQSITQDSSFPLVTGISPGYFYHLYGPGFVIYNPAATSTPGQPYTYPYVMFFDTSTEGFGPGTSIEQTGLAYSVDGLFWTRYGSVPILIPSGNTADWDGAYIYRPSVIRVQGIYHLFYSGANGLPVGSDGNLTAHGIGHASSSDGINWTLDSDNPIFYVTDGVAWRNNRTYTPFVLFFPFCDTGACPSCTAKMWFSGANNEDVRAIGYATLPCPALPPPLPPSNFVGIVKRNHCTGSSSSSSSSSSSDGPKYLLETTWQPSSTANVAYYRIYKYGKLVAVIPKGQPLIYVTCLWHRHAEHHCHHYFHHYKVAAVDTNNVESPRIKLHIVCTDDDS